MGNVEHYAFQKGAKKMNDVAKTPREELECKKKYLYEYSMFWECNDGSKCQILEEDVCEKLNEQQATIKKQEEIIKSQDMEISRQYNLCLAMSGVLREEFGVYDVFDRTKDRKID